MTRLIHRFGRRLRQIRRQKDMTQEQLAEAVGLSVDTISNIERGVNAPSFETLEKLAGALDVFVAQLFSFVQDETEERKLSK